MNANQISEIFKKYNAGEINKIEATTLLVFVAGVDAEAMPVVFHIYSNKPEDKIQENE